MNFRSQAVLTLCCFAVVSSAQQYRIFDLGANFVPQDVNKHGQVVGWTEVGGTSTAAIWDKTFGVQEIGVAAGYFESFGQIINDAGQVGGYVSGLPDHAFLWSESDGFTVLMDPDDQSRATEIGPLSEAGETVFVSNTGTGSNFYSRSSAGSISPFSVPVGIDGFGGVNVHGVYAVSNSYHQTGEFFYGNNFDGWSRVDGFGHPNESISLSGINDSGAIIGDSYSAPTNTGFYWSAQSGLVDLGMLNGAAVTPYGINNQGVVVGNGNSPFLWTNSSGLQDLNSMVTINPSNMELFGAWDINDSGAIIGYGLVNGEVHGYYAEAVPEPASMAVLGGLALVALRRRKKN